VEISSESDLKACFDKVLKRTKECVNLKGVGLQEAVFFKTEDLLEKLVQEHVSSYLLKLEALSPGSVEIFLNLDLKDSEDVNAAAFSTGTVESLLATFANESIANLVADALELAGLEGKIVLEKQQTDVDVLELTEGCFFPELTPAFSLNNTAFTDARLVAIDGFVENVHEINRLLEEAAASKEAVIIFARGISDEAIHTLKVNYDRKTLNVIPVIVKYDVAGVNLLKDVAVINGSDVISSLKGQLISSVELADFPRVDRVDLTSSGVLIECQRSNRLDRHIAFLQEKILSAENDESKKAIEKRVKNLGSRRVVVKLRSGNDWRKRSFEFDRCLRAVKLASTHGVVHVLGKTYPLSSLKTAKLYASQFRDSVDQIGCAVHFAA
jgi:chaperonin GroEL (HSP60 family)